MATLPIRPGHPIPARQTAQLLGIALGGARKPVQRGQLTSPTRNAA
ncbi:hypothetical protein AB0G86_24115 [Streptomyces scabiei]